MSIGMPSAGGSIGSEPGSVIVVADYRMADEAWRLATTGAAQRRASAPCRRSAAAAGIIPDTSPPNEAISLTSEEDT
jgi:hypothetical protein